MSFIRRGGLIYFDKSDLDIAYSENFSGIELIPEKKKARNKSDTKNAPRKKEKAPEIQEKHSPLDPEGFESELHYKVYEIIAEAENAVPFDIILHKTDTDIADLSEILLDLEIEGIITPVPGNRFGLK